VLGPAVAELNGTGVKTKRYVYAGGRKIAAESGASMIWSHAEPVTGSRGDSGASGYYIPKAEFNADGINVGFDPPQSSGFDFPEPIAPWGNVGLGSNCSVGNPNCVTCYLDHFEYDCSRINWETAQQCPNNDCGPRVVRGRDGNPHLTPLTTNPNNGTLGYWPDGYHAPGVVHNAFGNPMRLSPDSSSSAPFGGGTPIYDRFGVSVGVDENGNATNPTEWEYYVTGYTMPLSLATSINPQKSKSTSNDPASLFKKFLVANPECAKKVQAAGDKLGLGGYVDTPWTITDTYPALYDKPGIIPGQTGNLSTPRHYFDNHPGWAAATLFDPQGNRAGTFLGELYHVYYRWNPDESPGSPVFVSHPRGLGSKQLTLFDESLHNYFHMSHSELANALGVAFEGKDINALMALEAWAKGGCK
jgi:hypothetical protein